PKWLPGILLAELTSEQPNLVVLGHGPRCRSRREVCRTSARERSTAQGPEQPTQAVRRALGSYSESTTSPSLCWSQAVSGQGSSARILPGTRGAVDRNDRRQCCAVRICGWRGAHAE